MRPLLLYYKSCASSVDAGVPPLSQQPFTSSSSWSLIWSLAGWGPFSTPVFDERQVSACSREPFLTPAKNQCCCPPWLLQLLCNVAVLVNVHPARAFGMTALSFLIPLAFSLGKTRSKCLKLRFSFFLFLLMSEMWQLYGRGATPCLFITCPALERQLYAVLRQGRELGISGSLLCSPSFPTALQRALVPLASPRSTFFWLLMA